MVALWPAEADATPVNCGADYGTAGSFGGVALLNYLTGYGDPGCTGNRYRAFEYIVNTSPYTTVDYLGWPYTGGSTIGTREWDYPVLVWWEWGGLSPGGSGYMWTKWVTYYNSYGFQGDYQAKFSKTNYADFWQYNSY